MDSKNWLKSSINKYTVIALITGIGLLTFAHIFHEGLPFAKIIEELGLAFFIAAIVSSVYDAKYHQSSFIEPVRDIDVTVNSINEQVGRMHQKSSEVIEKSTQNFEHTVARFSEVVKFSQNNNLSSILVRGIEKHDQSVWQSKISDAIQNSKSHLLVVARSLDTLLPDKNRSVGIRGVLEDALRRGIMIVFIFSDPWTESTGLIKEMGTDPANATRRTIKQIIEIVESHRAYDRLLIRLSTNSLPFALFLTEQRLIVEHYLPYTEGGHTPIIEYNIMSAATHIQKNNISSHYISSCERLIGDTKDVYDVYHEWSTSHPQHEEVSHHNALYSKSINMRTTSTEGLFMSEFIKRIKNTSH